MQVEYHPVTERGVSQLMYVGDVSDLDASWVRTGAYVALGYVVATSKGVVRLAAVAAVLYGLVTRR